MKPANSRVKLAFAFMFFLAAFAVSSASVATSSIADRLTKKPDATVSASSATTTVLDATAAFVPKLRVIDATTIEVRYVVAPGHYMYRDRFRVDHVDRANTRAQTGQSSSKTNQSSTGSATVLALQGLPNGRLTDDATFGRVEVFDQDVSFRATLTSGSSASAKSAKPKARLKAGTQVRVTSQGCAVAGVCFPAHRHTFTLKDVPSPRGAPGEWLVAEAGDTSLGFGRKDQ